MSGYNDFSVHVQKCLLIFKRSGSVKKVNHGKQMTINHLYTGNSG